MPLKNDALKGAYITWSTKEDDAIGKIKSSKLSDDGFTFVAELDLNSIITFPKEKMMNKNEKLKDVNCICMFKDGDEVKAVAMRDVNNVLLEGSNLFTGYHGSKSKVVASASAKCNPNDIFDFNIGAKLALDRLYEGYDMTPKPKRKPYNGKIFIRCGDECVTLKNNHVYDVKNGTIRNKVGNAFLRPTFPYIFEGMCEDELSWAIDKFVYYGARYCCDHKGELLLRHYNAYFVNE